MKTLRILLIAFSPIISTAGFSSTLECDNPIKVKSENLIVNGDSRYQESEIKICPDGVNWVQYGNQSPFELNLIVTEATGTWDVQSNIGDITWFLSLESFRATLRLYNEGSTVKLTFEVIGANETTEIEVGQITYE